jgi:hypothetical protein
MTAKSWWIVAFGVVLSTGCAVAGDDEDAAEVEASDEGARLEEEKKKMIKKPNRGGYDYRVGCEVTWCLARCSEASKSQVRRYGYACKKGPRSACDVALEYLRWVDPHCKAKTTRLP